MSFGKILPFSRIQDVTAVASANMIPMAGSDGKLSSAWTATAAPPAGAYFDIAFIASPLPTLDSTFYGSTGYDHKLDQIFTYKINGWKPVEG